MENQFTEKESLAVITEMIERTCNNIQKNSASSMVYYGWVVAVVALANFALIYLLDNPARSFNVWWAMVPVSAVGFFLQARIDRSAIVRTGLDGIVSAIWRGFFISTVALLVVLFATASLLTPKVLALITPCILLLEGAAQFAAGKACRFRPFTMGAFVFWIGALLCPVSYLFYYGSGQFLILAACMIGGLALPGHALNRKATGHV